MTSFASWASPFRVTFLAAILAASAGCSAGDARESAGNAHEEAASASAADTARWKAVYVGDAHAGSVNRRSNVRAKTALVLTSDDTTLYLALYVCGKDATLAADTKWLIGKAALPSSGNLADLGGVTLKTADGWSAYVNMTGPGTITRDDGTTLQWVASYVGDGTTAGLYRHDFTDGTDASGKPLAGGVVGFIQWNGGSQGAVQLDHGGRVYQVTPVNPGTGTAVSGEAWGTFDGATAPVKLLPADPLALVNAQP